MASKQRESIYRVEYHGEMISLCDLSDLSGLSWDILYGRIIKHGWPVEKAVTTPVRRRAKNGDEKAYSKSRCKASSFRECFSCKFNDCVRSASIRFKDEPPYMMDPIKYSAVHALEKSMRLANIEREARKAGLSYGKYQYQQFMKEAQNE